MTIDILVKRKDEHASEKMLETLPNCPICGAKAYLEGDTVDGFWFGWSVGCPRYCLNDGIHGHNDNTPKRDRLAAHGFSTKYTAKRWWINRIKRAGIGGKGGKMKAKTKKIRRGLYKYKGYELRRFGYHQPDHCVLWEGVNIETRNADFHARTKRQLVLLIDEYEKSTCESASLREGGKHNG
ncbi:MAG: hypothetical protein OSJ43_06555 [Oscillospiraceae bacterium]|nr:hypothetical protein [Oscillospiraceae bacterium]